MIDWMENVTAEEALKASFLNKSENAAYEYKEIMLSLKRFIRLRNNETKMRIVIKNNINIKHLRYLGFEVKPLQGEEKYNYLVSW